MVKKIREFFILVVLFVLAMAGCARQINPTLPSTPTPTVCPTLGNAFDTDNTGYSGGFFAASNFTPDTTITVSCLNVKTDATAGYMSLAVYSDNGPGPGLLLGHTDIIPDTGGWVKTAITPLTLQAGHTYWFVSIGEINGIRIKEGDTAHLIYYYFFTWNNFLANGFPLSAEALPWNIYPDAGVQMNASGCR